MRLNQLMLLLLLFGAAGLAPVYAQQGNQDLGRIAVQLHTDRDVYVSGEDLFFRLLIDNHTGNIPDTAMYYLVLQNAAAENVARYMYAFGKHRMHGHVHLSDTLSTGIYHLLAYSENLASMALIPGRRILVINRFDQDPMLHDFLVPADSALIRAETGAWSDPGSLRVDLQTENPGTREQFGLEIINTGPEVNVSVSVRRAAPVFGNMDGRLAVLKGRHPFFGNAHNQLRDQAYFPLSGVVRSNASGLPVANARVMLSRPDSIPNLIHTAADARGRFRLDLTAYYFDSRVFLNLFEDSLAGESLLDIHSVWDITAEPDPSPMFVTDAGGPYFEMLANAAMVNKVYPIAYGVKQDKAPVHLPGTEPKLYASPSFSYHLEEYESLTDFQEITRELIPYIRVRQQSDRYTIRVMDETTSASFFNHPPRIFVNAMPINNMDLIAGYGSDQIARIDVVGRSWRYGELEFNGMVSIFLRDPEILDGIGSESLAMIDIPPVRSISHFVPPDYTNGSARQNRIPDYRQVLLWEPVLLISQNESATLSFFSGDLPGDYVIVVQGLDRNGNTVKYQKNFMIR